MPPLSPRILPVSCIPVSLYSLSSCLISQLRLFHATLCPLPCTSCAVAPAPPRLDTICPLPPLHSPHLLHQLLHRMRQSMCMALGVLR